MSISASIDIQLSNERITPIDIVSILINNGWTINDNGEKVFLPLNDDGMYDWHSERDITDNEVINILKLKDKAKESLGISLTWLDTNIGGEFVINHDLLITITLSNNRQVNGYSVTDFDWYLSKLVPLFQKENIYIELISFSHYN